MSLFNSQKKKAGNVTASETKLAAPQKMATTKKAMALPKAEKVAEAKAAKKNATEKREAAAQGVSFLRGAAIIKPRVTEKASVLSQNGIYTFDVRVDANSRQIAELIAATYKVTPVKVSIAPIKSKAMWTRGKKGKTVAGKKAYVYLKKGETIEFI